jgi:hypothetical protein
MPHSRVARRLPRVGRRIDIAVVPLIELSRPSESRQLCAPAFAPRFASPRRRAAPRLRRSTLALPHSGGNASVMFSGHTPRRARRGLPFTHSRDVARRAIASARVKCAELAERTGWRSSSPSRTNDRMVRRSDNVRDPLPVLTKRSRGGLEEMVESSAVKGPCREPFQRLLAKHRAERGGVRRRSGELRRTRVQW